MNTYFPTLSDKKQQITAFGGRKGAFAATGVPILAYLARFTKLFTKSATVRAQSVAKNLSLGLKNANLMGLKAFCTNHLGRKAFSAPKKPMKINTLRSIDHACRALYSFVAQFKTQNPKCDVFGNNIANPYFLRLLGLFSRHNNSLMSLNYMNISFFGHHPLGAL
jgi:hypothetical protein